MVENHSAEVALGTIGAICWTIQLLPQLWKSYRSQSTDGLSAIFIFMWGMSAGLFSPYVIIQNLNIPLILQPQLFGALSLASWGQCLYFGRKWSWQASLTVTVGVMAAVAGFAVGMVYALRPDYNHGDQTPAKALGILASVVIASALLPQYYEIWKKHEVVGISIPFMVVDFLGGVFSDLSLVFKGHIDVTAAVFYSLVVVMDGVVIIAALILNPLAARRRKRLEEDEASEVREGGHIDLHSVNDATV